MQARETETRPPLPNRSRQTDTIAERCAAQGLRMTGQRKIIAEILQESEDHPDAEELHARASARDPRISLATVYRTVKLFEEDGIQDHLVAHAVVCGDYSEE